MSVSRLKAMSSVTSKDRLRRRKHAAVMREFKAGKLKSSSGRKVTNPKQAQAIAISESRKLD